MCRRVVLSGVFLNCMLVTFPVMSSALQRRLRRLAVSLSFPHSSASNVKNFQTVLVLFSFLAKPVADT